MIRRIKGGQFRITCDDCGHEEVSDSTEFLGAIDEIKDGEWRITKDDDQWEHWCPDCRYAH